MSTNPRRFFGGRLSFTGPNMLSPKGVGSVKRAQGAEGSAPGADEPITPGRSDDAAANPTPNPTTTDVLTKTRRRLSMLNGVGDDNLIEGVADLVPEDGAGNESVQKTEEAKEAPVQTFIVSSYAGHSKKGFAPYNPRKKNQDALIMMEDPATKSLVLSVLDGHGEFGDSVAQYIKRCLEERLFAHPSFATDLRVAIAETVANIESEIISDESVDTDFSGTTMVLAVIRNNKLTVANVGDSRLTVAVNSGSYKAEAVTEDHKPDLPAERQRILNTGGRVFAVEYDDGVEGPARVWLGHMDVPGLAMSRSLGDVIAHTAGVSSQPDFFERELNCSDAMIILATDGLWEFITDQEVVDLAATCTEPSAAVNALIREANTRWMREEQVVDDTTVCVAFLTGR